MWFDLVLIGLSIVQLMMLAIAGWQIRRLRRERVDQADAIGGVPALLIINTLNKIDHRMDGLEEQLQHLVEQRRGTSQPAAPAAMVVSTTHDVPIASNYELAQQLAREGGDLDTLMERCKLSRNEAELVLRLYSGRG